MQIPIINASPNKKTNTSVFYGLNRTDRGNEGEFLDMVNMSSSHFPCLSPREKREEAFERSDIRAVIAPKYEDAEDKISSFTGVAGCNFYYRDEKIDFESDDDMDIPSGGDITLCDFNGIIVICVYEKETDKSRMYYYDYTATGSNLVKNMEKGVSGISCRVSSSGNPNEDASVTNCIEYVSGGGSEFTWNFEAGDSIFLEGFGGTYAVNNTVNMDSRFETADAKRAISCIVEKVEGKKLYFQMYNYMAERLVLKSDTSRNINTTANISIHSKLPVMNHVCVHNNRLWGTNPNGEYVYASKLGDCFNFNSFAGLSNDSYYSEIGTKGDFVGIVSYRDNLVAFKRDYIHHIYGDKPSNFTIPKQLSDCGCIDIKSAVEIKGVLYFLGYNGFYEYTGGQPSLISNKLNTTYKTAVGMSDGDRYIVSALRRDNGEYELLAYDTRYDVWHKEDSLKAVGSFKWHNKLYIAGSDGYVHIRDAAEGDEKVNWQCDSVITYEDIFDDKGVNEIWIRAKLSEGASVTVYTSTDGGDWIKHETLLPKGLKVYRVPVRFKKGESFQYRLKGHGAAVIYDIERIVYVGGRPYKKEW